MKKKNDILYEKRVVIKNNKFQLIRKKLNFPLLKLPNVKNGDVLEISPLSDLYLNKIFNHVSKFGGGIIIFDYGPLQKEKNRYYSSNSKKKKKCDFLEFPYESDITYHIDFRDIMQKSLKFNLKAYGPISQKKFLYFNGISERFISLSKKCTSFDKIKTLESHFNRLTDPQGMGNLIKCIYICKNKLDLGYFNED